MAFNVLSIPKRFHKTLSNLRTGIVLLLLVVIASALGTFILQRPATDAQKLQAAYSPQALQWLDRLGLTDVFHAWWFLTLLTLVSLSIVFVSIERFPNAWRFYARPYRKTDAHFRAANAYKVELPIKSAEAGLNAAERALKKLHWPVERIADNRESSLYSEKHRFSVMAVYVIHASLLLIFLGGIIDGVFGYRGFMSLVRGQQSNVIEMQDGSKKQIPFSVKCYSAGQENYADGSPKRWWSKLAVVKDGKEVETKEIVVNDPLTYQGLRFYQASYGMTGKLDGLKLIATPEGGTGREITLLANEPYDLDSNTSVTLAEYIPDFFIRDNQVFKRSDDAGEPGVPTEGQGQARLPRMRRCGSFRRTTRPHKVRKRATTSSTATCRWAYFTGLEVSHEPGQWFVWAGCLLMGVGLFVAFYMVHMRLWVTAIPDAKGKLVLWLGGAANKNKDRFEQKFNEVVDEIRKEIDSTSRGFSNCAE